MFLRPIPPGHADLSVLLGLDCLVSGAPGSKPFEGKRNFWFPFTKKESPSGGPFPCASMA